MNRQTRATLQRGEERLESTMIACLPQEREFGQQLKEGQEKTDSFPFSLSPLAPVLAWVGMGLMEAVAMLMIVTPVTRAIQLGDGTVSFEKSPLLIGAVTTFQEVRVWEAKYYFTITVPKEAGEPLAKVTITQRQGAENLRFQVEKTLAFEGSPRSRGKSLRTETISLNAENTPLEVTFLPPVPPGSTVTIGLKPRQNPQWGGVYLFGVTAFPAGEKARGLYLGVGRLQFYAPGYR